MSPRLYLDHAATTYLADAAREVLEDPAVPPLESALARLVSAFQLEEDQRLHLTSGGTEANGLVLRAATWGKRRAHLVSQPTEHPCVLRTLEALSAGGAEVTLLGVDHEGRVDPQELRDALRPETALVSIMAANHETGARQPLEELHACCRAAGVPFHSDGVQALRHGGVAELSADAITFSGHKLHGPRGLGGLILRGGALPELAPPQGLDPRRVLALARALESEPRSDAAALARSRDALEAGLLALPGASRNGPALSRLPGHLNVSFRGLSSEALVLELDLAGVSASSGAACSSGDAQPSHVLLAMGRSPAEASASLRLSLGHALEPDSQERVLRAVSTALARLRTLSGE